MLPPERTKAGRDIEIEAGYDGVVVASGGAQAPFPLTRRHLFQALAAALPVAGEILRNPYRTWNEIDPQLPDMPIEVVGPLLDSDTGQAMVRSIMGPGCRTFPAVAALDAQEAARICTSVRNDGVFEQIKLLANSPFFSSEPMRRSRRVTGR